MLQLDGVNFGPASPRQFITSALLGPFPMTSCNVSVPHLQLLCVTPSGYGANVHVAVAVADEASPLSAIALSYARPAIAALDPPAVPTLHGTVVTVSGTNFGAAVGVVSVLVNGAAVTRFSLVPPGHYVIEFTTDDYNGMVSLSVQVLVAGQESNVVMMDVLPPVITAVSLFDMVSLKAAEAAVDPCVIAVGGNVNADVAEVAGANFGGSLSTVTMTFEVRTLVFVVVW